jgi:hypothetical protein
VLFPPQRAVSVYCLFHFLFFLLYSFLPVVEIVVANYSGKDVTEYVKSKFAANKYFSYNVADLGDPNPGLDKFFHVIYCCGGVYVCFYLSFLDFVANRKKGAINIEDGKGFEPTVPKLHIILALYGSFNVTDKIRVQYSTLIFVFFFSLEGSNTNNFTEIDSPQSEHLFLHCFKYLQRSSSGYLHCCLLQQWCTQMGSCQGRGHCDF